MGKVLLQGRGVAGFARKLLSWRAQTGSRLASTYFITNTITGTYDIPFDSYRLSRQVYINIGKSIL